MTNYPVLRSPDFDKQLQLSIDASDTGIGAMLTQKNEEGVTNPVSYFSKKLNDAQKSFSNVEKECVGLILALEHYHVYLRNANMPIKVFTDHNPLVFISKFRSKNQRLMK